MAEIEREALNLLSMQVILHAGNARDFIFQAVKESEKGRDANAKQLMKQANAAVVQAHQLQTETLKKEAEGIIIPYSPLFGHAQDTLMTVKSEIGIMTEILKLYQIIGGKRYG